MKDCEAHKKASHVGCTDAKFTAVYALKQHAKAIHTTQIAPVYAYKVFSKTCEWFFQQMKISLNLVIKCEVNLKSISCYSVPFVLQSYQQCNER